MFFRFLGYPVSGSWTSNLYQIWVPSHQSDQVLVGYSHNLCATIEVTHFFRQGTIVDLSL